MKFMNQFVAIRGNSCSLKQVIVIVFVIVIALVCCSCSVTRTIPVETIKQVTKTDTLYLNTFRFDSTYVSHERLEKDTLIHSPYKGETEGVLIKETNTEIRYRILRDTIERVKIEVQRDSIPYEVRIEAIKEVPRKRNWLDTVSLTFFFTFLFGSIIYLLSRLRGLWK